MAIGHRAATRNVGDTLLLTYANHAQKEVLIYVDKKTKEIQTISSYIDIVSKIILASYIGSGLLFCMSSRNLFDFQEHSRNDFDFTFSEK